MKEEYLDILCPRDEREYKLELQEIEEIEKEVEQELQETR